jgi:tetrahydromethanopterin S-methyltransferase subunit C
MTQPPPRKKFGLRDYVGGLAAMLFGFGIISFLMGSAVPWGYQQVGGLIAAILGLILMAVRLWLPRV